MKEFLRKFCVTVKKFFTTEVLILLLLLNTVFHYANFRFEKVDLPNATKKLVVDTIKNELTRDPETKEIKNLENVLDEISYASQLGRLDTISLILAMFALVLGFGAVVGFMHIKENSERIAEIESKKWLAENFDSWLKRNPELLQKIIEKALVTERVEKESESINGGDIAKQDWS